MKKKYKMLLGVNFVSAAVSTGLFMITNSLLSGVSAMVSIGACLYFLNKIELSD